MLKALRDSLREMQDSTRMVLIALVLALFCLAFFGLISFLVD